jgi:UDP-GlcNAc:undecaprenyl-phosphate/decaprenyl-phosphate GlcNAc-1-phosphate transferase
VSISDFIPILAAFGLVLVSTPLVRAVARRYGAVAPPREDRWHRQPTALLGGVAIFLATMTATLAFVQLTPRVMVVLAASAFLFVVGLVDDFLHIKAYQKLVAQIMGATLVIGFGLILPWTAFAPLNMLVTIFWLVGITNAINFLDNMDGLAAGIAAIASSFLAVHFLTSGQETEALMLGVFTATLLGFLIYNSNPASIFMGDCGSMFIGFFLASGALLSVTGGRVRFFLPVLAVPVLTLSVPIFDTILVTILRKLAGRAASLGGRDHTSHRLVALGMSERHAVWMIYGLAAAAGLLGMLVRDAQLDVSLAAVAGFTVLLTLLGIYLAGVEVYSEEEVAAARQRPLVSFLVNLSHKRRIFEVLLDVVLITLAYYSAFAFYLGLINENFNGRMFLQTLPVIIFVKLAANLLTGVYRGLWRYTSIGDLVVYAKATLLGTAGSVLVILFAFNIRTFSRAIFVADCLLFFIALAGSRLTFRFLRQVLPTKRVPEGRRILIYGADDAGELLLRVLRNNPELEFSPVGFIDDDPGKKGRVIHGLRVFGDYGHLHRVCIEQGAEEVVISSARFSEERIADIRRECKEQGITFRRVRIVLEQLTED